VIPLAHATTGRSLALDGPVAVFAKDGEVFITSNDPGCSFIVSGKVGDAANRAGITAILAALTAAGLPTT
jgi:hypothetical protein